MNDGRERVEELRDLLQNDDLWDDVRLFMFSTTIWSGEEMSSLRRTLCPDGEYFSSDFRHRRHELACQGTYIHSYQCQNWFRLLLSRSRRLKSGDVDFNWSNHVGLGILHGIAGAVARTAGTAEQGWCAVASEVLQIVERHDELSRVHYPDRPESKITYRSPFQNLLMNSCIWMYSAPGKEFKIQTALNVCDKNMKVWLKLVQQAGFDLKEYGTQEKRQLASGKGGDPQEHTVYGRDRASGGGVIYGWTMKIRLIAFTYGSEVDDWKLWWSEPTDELVGDFWRYIDPEPLCIPGSWVE
ncbi:hypothetical protein F4803DRAFT_555475 [Xylaria telfairii]|nr:hypothetical protein F4803DRAFT_555475 [Xylaria telfairii]